MFKKAFSVFFSSVASRVIVIASTPVIAGLVGPSTFGALASLIAYMTFLSPLLTLRLCVLLPQKMDADRDYFFSLIATVIICLTIPLVLVTAFSEDLSSLPVLGAAFLALYQTSCLMALKQGLYKKVNILTVLQTMLGAGGKVICAQLGGGVTLLLLFHIVQNSLSFPFLLAGHIKRVRLNKFLLVDAKRFVTSNRKLIVQRVPAQVLLGLSSLIPIAFISYHFGQEYVGYWGLAYALIMLPLAVVTSSVSQVFWIEISSLRNELNKLSVLTVKVGGIGFFLSLFLYFVFVFWGAGIFSLFFDDEWIMAFSIAKVLMLLLPCYLSGSHLVHVLTVLEKHNYFQLLNTLRFALLALLCGITYIAEIDILQFVNGFVLVMYIYFFVNILMVVKGLKDAD
jgi:O-antigen/teichoic acid export membrane protein